MFDSEMLLIIPPGSLEEFISRDQHVTATFLECIDKLQDEMYTFECYNDQIISIPAPSIANVFTVQLQEHKLYRAQYVLEEIIQGNNVNGNEQLDKALNTLRNTTLIPQLIEIANLYKSSTVQQVERKELTYASDIQLLDQKYVSQLMSCIETLSTTFVVEEPSIVVPAETQIKNLDCYFNKRLNDYEYATFGLRIDGQQLTSKDTLFQSILPEELTVGMLYKSALCQNIARSCLKRSWGDQLYIFDQTLATLDSQFYSQPDQQYNIDNIGPKQQLINQNVTVAQIMKNDEEYTASLIATLDILDGLLPPLPIKPQYCKDKYLKKIYYSGYFKRFNKMLKQFLQTNVLRPNQIHLFNSQSSSIRLSVVAGSVQAQKIKQHNEFWDLIECFESEVDDSFMIPAFHEQLQISIEESMAKGYSFFTCKYGHIFTSDQEEYYDDESWSYQYGFVCPMCKSHTKKQNEWPKTLETQIQQNCIHIPDYTRWKNISKLPIIE